MTMLESIWQAKIWTGKVICYYTSVKGNVQDFSCKQIKENMFLTIFLDSFKKKRENTIVHIAFYTE